MNISKLNKQNNELIKLLYKLRESSGIRQVDLANKLDVHQSFISKYESGERKLDLLEVREICTVLGMDFIKFCTQLEKRINGSR